MTGPRTTRERSGIQANQDIVITSSTNLQPMNKLPVLAAFMLALVGSEAKADKSPDPENLLTIELENGPVVIELLLP